nr:serine/arginine-rich SC35-like splicing factor SCL33 [Tanacetum cinerariifolium]
MGRRGYSPSPPRGGYERRRRIPSPRSRYSGAGSRGRPVERDLPTSLLVRNLRLDCRGSAEAIWTVRSSEGHLLAAGFL